MSRKIIEGYNKYYHKNGEISKEGNILNGKRSGTWKFYDNYGVLEKEENYLKGKKDGYFVHFQRNKKIKDGTYRNNKIYESNIKKYINENNETRYESYREGKKHGQWKIDFHKKGTRQPYTETINYRNGKKHGENILEYHDGVRISYNYKNGKKNGEYLRTERFEHVITEEKKIVESGFYKDNKKSGEWILFSTDSEVQQRLLYKNGKKNGECFFYNSWYGKKERKIRVSHNFPKLSEFFNHEEVHKLELIDSYVRNRWIRDTKLTIDFKDDQIHGLFTMIVTNRMGEEGKLYEFNFNNGKRHGLSTCFHISHSSYDDFKKDRKSHYKNGKLHGKYYEYDNESVRESTYKNQELHGPYEWYDIEPSGERFTIEKGQYKNDEKDGIWKYYQYPYKNKVIKKGETWEKGKLLDSKEY